MSTIVTRAGKGSALTHNEVDANFNNLNNDKIEAAQTVTLTNKTLSTGTAITDGTINNATIGASTPSSGAFTTLSATGVTTVQAGTAAAPAITTSGDTNTGIFFPAADTIAFTEGGVESMRIDSSGNVLVGQTANVLQPGSYTPDLSASGFNDGGLAHNQYSTSAAVGAQLWLSRSKSATIGQTVVASGDQLAAINFSGSDGANFVRGARITGEVDGTPASNSMPGRLVFSTTPSGSSTPTERMRIDSSGNLGLGVTPSTWTIFKALELDAAGTGLAGSAGQPVLFSNCYYNGGWKYADNGFAANYDQSNGRHRWFNVASGTAGNAISFTQAMTLTSAGELLVGGTTSISSHEAISVQRENATPVISTFRNDTSIASADLLGAIQFFGNDTTSNTPTALSYIYATASGTHAAGDNPTDIVFGTTPDGSATVAEAGRITQSGAYVLKGGTTTAAAGVGIIFPATQVASANANCLDDYEEGTFTPTIVGTTTAGTATYSVQVGRYTKVGNRVLFEARVTYTGGTGTGNLRLAGLPFTSNANCQSSLAANYGNLVLTASNIAQCYVIGSSTSIAIEQYPTGGGAATSVAYDAAATILVAGHYEV